VPKSRELWAGVAAGKLEVERFGLNGAWVPWYNLHKLFAGLRDAYVIGGNAQARDVLIALSDWCAGLLSHLSDAQVQQMLGAEQGGMNEVLADVYALTGDRKYLALAQRFSHRALLEPLARHEDTLTGLHANTQIPKFIGTARQYELTGDESCKAASLFFWSTVVHERSYVIGGHSDNEAFSPKETLSTALGPNTTETCNTYNMLKLTRHCSAGTPMWSTPTTTSAPSITTSWHPRTRRTA